MKTLQDLYNTPGVMGQLEQLFNECADELALKDMNAGADVSYVPKNKSVYRLMKNKLDSAYGHKEPPSQRKNRAE